MFYHCGSLGPQKPTEGKAVAWPPPVRPAQADGNGWMGGNQPGEISETYRFLLQDTYGL